MSASISRTILVGGPEKRQRCVPDSGTNHSSSRQCRQKARDSSAAITALSAPAAARNVSICARTAGSGPSTRATRPASSQASPVISIGRAAHSIIRSSAAPGISPRTARVISHSGRGQTLRHTSVSTPSVPYDPANTLDRS